jgi:hypothetical protein
MGTADNSTIWSGGIRQLPASTDMTDSIVSWPWRYSSMSHVGPDGNCVVFFDSAGNWAAFRVSKKSGISSSPSMYVNHVDTNATPFDSSGSIDWSDITHMGFAYRRNTTATLMYYEVGAIAYTKKAGGGAITGGSAESPVTLKTFAEPALGFLRNMDHRRWINPDLFGPERRLGRIAASVQLRHGRPILERGIGPRIDPYQRLPDLHHACAQLVLRSAGAVADRDRSRLRP